MFCPRYDICESPLLFLSNQSYISIKPKLKLVMFSTADNVLLSLTEFINPTVDGSGLIREYPTKSTHYKSRGNEDNRHVAAGDISVCRFSHYVAASSRLKSAIIASSWASVAFS